MDNSQLDQIKVKDFEEFKVFLRDLIMHGAVGTALGGVCTIVGEPQNLLIAKIAAGVHRIFYSWRNYYNACFNCWLAYVLSFRAIQNSWFWKSTSR